MMMNKHIVTGNVDQVQTECQDLFNYQHVPSTVSETKHLAAASIALERIQLIKQAAESCLMTDSYRTDNSCIFEPPASYSTFGDHVPNNTNTVQRKYRNQIIEADHQHERSTTRQQNGQQSLRLTSVTTVHSNNRRVQTVSSSVSSFQQSRRPAPQSFHYQTTFDNSRRQTSSSTPSSIYQINYNTLGFVDPVRPAGLVYGALELIFAFLSDLSGALKQLASGAETGHLTDRELGRNTERKTVPNLPDLLTDLPFHCNTNDEMTLCTREPDMLPETPIRQQQRMCRRKSDPPRSEDSRQQVPPPSPHPFIVDPESLGDSDHHHHQQQHQPTGSSQQRLHNNISHDTAGQVRSDIHFGEQSLSTGSDLNMDVTDLGDTENTGSDLIEDDIDLCDSVDSHLSQSASRDNYLSVPQPIGSSTSTNINQSNTSIFTQTSPAPRTMNDNNSNNDNNNGRLDNSQNEANMADETLVEQFVELFSSAMSGSELQAQGSGDDPEDDQDNKRSNLACGGQDSDHEFTKEIVHALRSIGDNLDTKLRASDQMSAHAVLGTTKLNVGKFLMSTLRHHKVAGVALGATLEACLFFKRL